MNFDVYGKEVVISVMLDIMHLYKSAKPRFGKTGRCRSITSHHIPRNPCIEVMIAFDLYVSILSILNPHGSVMCLLPRSVKYIHTCTEYVRVRDLCSPAHLSTPLMDAAAF